MGETNSNKLQTDFFTAFSSQWYVIPLYFVTISVFFEVGRGLNLFFYVWWLATKTRVSHRSVAGKLMCLFYLFLIAIHFSGHSEDTHFIKPGIIWLLFFTLKKGSFRILKDFSWTSIPSCIQISRSNQQSLLRILVWFYLFIYLLHFLDTIERVFTYNYAIFIANQVDDTEYSYFQCKTNLRKL